MASTAGGEPPATAQPAGDDDDEVVFEEVLTRVANLAEDCILQKRGRPTPDPSSGLFLGIRAAAEEANILRQHNITTVVSVGTWPERVRAHSFGHNQELLQRHCAIRLPGSTFNSMRIESCLRLLHKLNQVVEETAEAFHYVGDNLDDVARPAESIVIICIYRGFL